MAERPALGAHRHTTFAGVLGGSASPAGQLGCLPRARFPAHGKRGCWRAWHASAIAIATTAIDVAQPGSPRGGVAVGLARVNAGAVADELGGRSRLHHGRVVVEGKGVPGLAHSAIVALSARAPSGVRRRVFRGRGGTADGRFDQVLPRYPCLSPPLRRLVPLGPWHTPPPRFWPDGPPGRWDVGRYFLHRTVSYRLCAPASYYMIPVAEWKSHSY